MYNLNKSLHEHFRVNHDHAKIANVLSSDWCVQVVLKGNIYSHCVNDKPGKKCTISERNETAIGC